MKIVDLVVYVGTWELAARVGPVEAVRRLGCELGQAGGMAAIRGAALIDAAIVRASKAMRATRPL